MSGNGPRLAVLSYLTDHGGVVSDPAGGAAKALGEALGYQSTQGLSWLLKRMEDDGLISRQKSARRTFEVRVTDAGRRWATPKGPAPKQRSTPKPERRNFGTPPKPAGPKPAFPENVPWEKLPVDHDEVCRSQARSMKWMDLAS